MKKLGEYMNGNTLVTLYEDGTKVMFTKDDEFKLDFPTNIDIKITNYCNVGGSCTAHCYEAAGLDGKHAPLNNFNFIQSLTPGTEVALGGGALTTHSRLKEILLKFKKRGVIVNVTVHIKEVLKNADMLEKYQRLGLIHGIGVSMPSHEPNAEERIALSKLKNVVFHVINGTFDIGYFETLSKSIEHPKLLILGYKHFRKGNNFYELQKKYIDKRQEALKKNIKEIANLFEVVSFDNLALEQLDIKNSVSEKEWKFRWMGEEGTMTFYIDAVEGKFAKNSISDKRYPLKRNVREMFNIIKGE